MVGTNRDPQGEMAVRTDVRIFDCLYEPIDGDECVYCGLPRTGWDHVPPLHFVARMAEEDRNRANLRKYPCCQECNSFLGSHILRTFEDRKRHVRARIRRKYRKWIEMPDWDSEELSELSTEDARRYIQSHARFSRAVKSRLAHQRAP